MEGDSVRERGGNGEGGVKGTGVSGEEEPAGRESVRDGGDGGGVRAHNVCVGLEVTS